MMLWLFMFFLVLIFNFFKSVFLFLFWSKFMLCFLIKSSLILIQSFVIHVFFLVFSLIFLLVFLPRFLLFFILTFLLFIFGNRLLINIFTLLTWCDFWWRIRQASLSYEFSLLKFLRFGLMHESIRNKLSVILIWFKLRLFEPSSSTSLLRGASPSASSSASAPLLILETASWELSRIY